MGASCRLGVKGRPFCQSDNRLKFELKKELVGRGAEGKLRGQRERRAFFQVEGLSSAKTLS